MKTLGISIEEWCELAKEGVSVPVEIKLSGASMQPLIRMNRDTVTILPLEKMQKDGSGSASSDPSESPLQVGDIVMFRLPGGIAVVHRIFRIEGERIITLGDNLPDPDSPLHPSQILGKVVRIQRGRKTLLMDSKKMQRYGKICMDLLPVRKKVLHFKYWLRKKQGK